MENTEMPMEQKERQSRNVQLADSFGKQTLFKNLCG